MHPETPMPNITPDLLRHVSDWLEEVAEQRMRNEKREFEAPNAEQRALIPRVPYGINSDPHALANAAQTLRYEARRLAR